MASVKNQSLHKFICQCGNEKDPYERYCDDCIERIQTSKMKK